MRTVRYIDLFCGVGGFRYAMTFAAKELGISCHCVFSSDIDVGCQTVYANNFGERPIGDITKIAPFKYNRENNMDDWVITDDIDKIKA